LGLSIEATGAPFLLSADDAERRLTLRQADQATATEPPAASSFPVNARWLRRSTRPWTDKRELGATSR
jgi:hypothetical protein